MACLLFGTKPLSEPNAGLLIWPLKTNLSEIWIKTNQNMFEVVICKMSAIFFILNVLNSSIVFAEMIYMNNNFIDI